MTTLDNATVASAPVLRRLYFVRVGFAVVWAVLLGVTASDLGVAAGVLLVTYPLFDVAAAVVDFRASRARELILNIVISSLAAVGLGLAATAGIPAVLRVFGGWAIVSGVVQLIVAVRRRKLGGQAIGFLQEHADAITSNALTTAGAVGEFLTGALLTLFITIFFLAGGDGIWSFLMKGVPADVRPRVALAGRRGFASLVSYVRATAVVAVVDAVGIGLGLWIIDVPLAIPLATLVFLAAFVPIIGSVVAGAVAVLVALVTNGIVTALVVLGIVIAVMQLESHILQPLLLSRAVELHPLAVVLAISVGLVAGSIAGALLAVPLLAVLNTGIRSLLHDRAPQPDEDPVDDASGTEPVPA